MHSFKTSTFLTGIFSKFRLRDKDIREAISALYSTLIDSILKETSEKKRILIFKSLMPAIQGTIEYFEYIKKNNLSVDRKLLCVTSKLILHCTHVVQEIGIKDDNTSQVFDDIMKQVLIDEIACDIGVCLRQYKKTTRATEKSGITAQLTVLLADYNVVMHTDLTPASVLESKKDE